MRVTDKKEDESKSYAKWQRREENQSFLRSHSQLHPRNGSRPEEDES